MTATPTRCYEVAIHEAGHAVIGHVLDIVAPDTVLVHDGHRGHVNRYIDDLLLDDRGLENLIAESLAGIAAMETLGVPDPDRGAARDRRNAGQLAALLDTGRADAIVDHGLARARGLTHQHRSALEHFARALDGNSGRLAGSEVTRALVWARADRTWSRAAAFDVDMRRRDLFERRARPDMSREDLAELWASTADEALRGPSDVPIVVSTTDSYRARMQRQPRPTGWLVRSTSSRARGVS